jgi:hypothetical protein
VHGERHQSLPQSSSASRFTASGFLNLRRFETVPSRPHMVVTHNGIGAHIHCSAHLRRQITVYQLNPHFPPSLVPSWSS